MSTPATLIALADRELAESLELVGARPGVLLRFAAIETADGQPITMVARIPDQEPLALRPAVRAELAEGLRAAADALDAAGGHDRHLSRPAVERAIASLEQSHGHARGRDALLELRLRLGRLGLPTAA